MAKNLEEKFKLYCDSENLEINQNQIIVIKKLQDYFNENFKKSMNTQENPWNLKIIHGTSKGKEREDISSPERGSNEKSAGAHSKILSRNKHHVDRQCKDTRILRNTHTQLGIGL